MQDHQRPHALTMKPIPTVRHGHRMIISPESRSERSLSDENGELRAALEQAQRAGDAYKDLLLAAAHEMRTPLHAIGLHLQMVARLSAGDRKEAAQIQIARAKRVLNDHVKRTSMLLDAARINRGMFSLTTEPVCLTDLASSVCELYAANAEFQQTRIDVSVPDVVGHWDRAAVETILGNLVSNALKYGEGTPVHIAGTTNAAGNAVIRVADSGPGIRENQRQRIFEEFGSLASESGVAGYGLGLWIASQLARLHGGSISVDATATGAAFVVTLPLGTPATSRSLS